VTDGTTASGPTTLSLDIGGTGLKAGVLDAQGALVGTRLKRPTTYPMPPERMVDELAALVEPLPPFDRVSAGFPGMVRGGVVLSAPKFNTVSGPETAIDPALDRRWHGFDLAAALSSRLGKPTRVVNDADMQGAAVVQGHGLELVVTLGTGVGTALFLDGQLLPHLEMAHQPFRKGETYDQQLGDAAMKDVGRSRWNKRVQQAIENFDGLFFFDHVYLGGGNASRVDLESLGYDDRVSIVDNSAGILGGITLWETRPR
jgi:polyphosphate glucokinase